MSKPQVGKSSVDSLRFSGKPLHFASWKSKRVIHLKALSGQRALEELQHKRAKPQTLVKDLLESNLLSNATDLVGLVRQFMETVNFDFKSVGQLSRSQQCAQPSQRESAQRSTEPQVNVPAYAGDGARNASKAHVVLFGRADPGGVYARDDERQAQRHLWHQDQDRQALKEVHAPTPNMRANGKGRAEAKKSLPGQSRGGGRPVYKQLLGARDPRKGHAALQGGRQANGYRRNAADATDKAQAAGKQPDGDVDMEERPGKDRNQAIAETAKSFAGMLTELEKKGEICIHLCDLHQGEEVSKTFNRYFIC
ncbi:hypothetical protein ON010_g6884 [Phytophthora cinnamomi]|nr:hypothetical protein ON010_g6884 [Phytophthora cinnamomi]